MGVLSDKQIVEAVEEGHIEIDPFVEDNVQPASVDFTLGPEAFRASDDDKMILEPGDVLTLRPGEMAILLTREDVKLSAEYAATIGLRSRFTRKGIDLLAGPQVDPGFDGPLHIVLINLSPSEQVIEHGERFLTLEFRKLREPSDTTYTGQYQSQSTITAEEIRDLKKGEGIALSEAVKAMQTIARDVDALETSVTRLTKNVDRYMQIFIATIVTLVAGVLGYLYMLA